MSSAILKRVLPEIKEEYIKIRELHEEAWNRKYQGTQSKFDDEYLSVANMLIQTLGHIIESEEE